MSRPLNVFIAALCFLAILPYDAVSSPSRDVVHRAQTQLKALGYNPGRPDGLFGKRTQTALLQFQRKHHLPETGRIDNPTLAQLEAVTSPKPPTPMSQPAPPAPQTVVKESATPTAIDEHEKSSRSRVALKTRDPRLDQPWSIVSPPGCYWQCQQSSGCKAGKGIDKRGMAKAGEKRGVASQGFHKSPGWTRVCD